jgi:hypothetical protein
MAWVYLFPRASGDPYTVGHYAPDGTWHPDSDHTTSEEAAKRVHYLNGGTDLTAPLNQYGEGIGKCIQGQFERSQR